MGTHERCRTRLLLITTFFWVSVVIVVIGVPDDECPDTNPASETCEYDEVCDEARCKYNEYATCHPNRCGTCEAVFRTYDHAMVNCTRLTPKCRLMHLEMLHNRQSAAGSSASDEVWDLVDLDEPFEPSCHSNGSFQSKQCDSDSGLCWCVDSAGVRVTDKKVDGPQCVRLVQVHLIQIDLEFRDDTNKIILGRTPELKRRVAEMMVREYTIKKSQIVEISVKETQLKVSIKISENNTKEPVDIATVAYYVERDCSCRPLRALVAFVWSRRAGEAQRAAAGGGRPPSGAARRPRPLLRQRGPAHQHEERVPWRGGHHHRHRTRRSHRNIRVCCCHAAITGGEVQGVLHRGRAGDGGKKRGKYGN
ncbi:tumor-associated calcium signal transducer 2-like isoform X1 [Lampetra planeri]